MSKSSLDNLNENERFMIKTQVSDIDIELK